ncbi:restriction endonuclease subunit S [Flavobacterium granuli]|uniref:Type I restriction enzyme S subunit n=1 Tax=Flavobacterium granuli TaxID=280093 RepID=A0A1M5Q5U0_9FLAO|nr:restriction endonuclease subunit S [Flavobacterium granuli]PRZ22080.1 type I restriction enzyme S subunit [Flavobacterium granuli]SHH09296.1 type I restriction enzyme, S subunit [Flavobacterium granuli]
MIKKTNTLIPEIRFPEFLNEAEWVENTFEELFKIGNGRDYKHLGKGEIPVYGSGGYMLSVNDYLYDGESVCIGRKGTIDKPMFLSGKFWTVDTLFYTHSFKNCLPKYIHYVFQNINWLKHNEAGGVPSLSKTNIYKIKTLVPKPKEQQKIVSCLSSLDELIKAHNQKIEALKNHKKGLMQNLFPQEGEIVPKYRFPEFVNDGDWDDKKLGKICDVRDGTHDSPKYIAKGFPLITSKNLLNNGSMDFTNVSFITEEDYVQINKRSKVDKGDILFGMIGTIGNPVVVKTEGFAIKNVALIKDIGKLNQEFLAHQLKSNFIQKQFEKVNAGGILKFIALGIIRNLKVIVPSPKEQQKIASCLSSLDDLITGEADKIEQLNLYKKGLMQGLFPKINN